MFEPLAQSEKARQLAKAVLPASDWEDFEKYGRIVVKTSQFNYHIYKDSMTCIEKKGAIYGYACIQSVTVVPSYDRMLAECLLIRNDEQRYLRTANIIRRNEADKLILIQAILFAADIALATNLILKVLGF